VFSDELMLCPFLCKSDIMHVYARCFAQAVQYSYYVPI